MSFDTQPGAAEASFHDAFIGALYGAGAPGPTMAAVAAQPGFAVYRNTILKGCIDTLAANYPTVARLVGDEWFRAAALVYVQGAPPVEVSLLEYGRDFPHFLASFEPARGLPYLADVARLDRLWIEVHVAADEDPLDAVALTALAPADLGQAVLCPHPSARWRWFDHTPAYSIWAANRELREIPGELAWGGEGALLTRRDGGVCWLALGAGAVAFLDACGAGVALEPAALQALERQPDLNIAGMLSELIGAGAFRASTTEF